MKTLKKFSSFNTNPNPIFIICISMMLSSVQFGFKIETVAAEFQTEFVEKCGPEKYTWLPPTPLRLGVPTEKLPGLCEQVAGW
jgi:hypothetical protein